MTDLTTLARAKAWLAIKDTEAADTILRRLITSASGFVLSYLERDSFDVVERDERYDGGGSGFMLLRESPILSIEALEIDGVGTLTASTSGSRGYRIADAEPGLGRQRISLVNAIFPVGTDNVRVRYTTGQRVSEAFTLPAVVSPATTVRFEPTRPFLRDLGVVIEDEDVEDHTVADGVYVFPAAYAEDEGVATYATVPPEIEQAVCELVGERYKTRDRIGQTSASLGQQQTIQFSTKDMNDFVRTILSRYMRSAPL